MIHIAVKNYSVLKVNFVSSLQGYGNSLEQVLCFQGFEGDLCYSSTQIGKKFCSFAVPRSSRFDGYWHEVVRCCKTDIFVGCWLLPLLLLRLRSPLFLQCWTERRYPERWRPMQAVCHVSKEWASRRPASSHPFEISRPVPWLQVFGLSWWPSISGRSAVSGGCAGVLSFCRTDHATSCIDLGTTDASVWLAYSRSNYQPNSHSNGFVGKTQTNRCYWWRVQPIPSVRCCNCFEPCFLHRNGACWQQVREGCYHHTIVPSSLDMSRSIAGLGVRCLSLPYWEGVVHCKVISTT